MVTTRGTLVLILLCGIRLADAASLRPDARLHGPVVRLSDLFDDAGAQADRVLGPAPPPGGRYIVEARQLGAIAHQFDVDWSPRGGERIAVERAGQPLARARVMAALTDALRGAGAPEDADIRLTAYEPPMVPVDIDVSVQIETLDYQPNGHFAARVAAVASGDATVTSEVSGTVTPMQMLVVPRRRIGAGELISADDIEMRRVPEAASADPVLSLSEAINKAPRHALPAGRPVPRGELGPPILVRKGEPVRLVLQLGGLSVNAVGVALDSAGTDETVHVRNAASGAVIEAIVTGPNQARVQPDSRPINQRGAALAVLN